MPALLPLSSLPGLPAPLARLAAPCSLRAWSDPVFFIKRDRGSRLGNPTSLEHQYLVRRESLPQTPRFYALNLKPKLELLDPSGALAARL